MAHYIPASQLGSNVSTRQLDVNMGFMDQQDESGYVEEDDGPDYYNHATPTDIMLKREQKDVELDKKIEALRRKNEALKKRHQEVEEDRKRAEEEGMALQGYKGKAEDLTITINKSTSEPRMVVTKTGTGGSPTPKGGQPGEGEGCLLGSGRGRRRQLMVTMTGNTKGKRVVSERTERKPGPPGPLDAKSPAEDGQRGESGGRGKHPHTAKRDAGAQDEVRQVQGGLTEERHWLSECASYYQDPEGPGQPGQTDLTIPTSREEQEEYLRWKRDRELIDRERVARHKNDKGQWRRAWDVDKTENMFPDKTPGERDRGPQTRGGRSAKRGHPKSHPDTQRHHTRGKDKGGKNLPVVSSKAKGKDRLTGRAKRCDADEEGELLQASETSLEEFLEELDALDDPDVYDPTTEAPVVKEDDLKMECSPSQDVVKTPEVVSSARSEGVKVSGPATSSPDQAEGAQASIGTPREDTHSLGKAEALSPRSPEKKVRFSEELIERAYERPSLATQNSACSETKIGSSLKSTCSRDSHEVLEEPKQPPENFQKDAGKTQDQGDLSAADAHAESSSKGLEQREVPKLPDASKGITPITNSHTDDKASAPQKESYVVPLGHAKSNSNRNTEELIDSSLSVLSLESEETHPARSTSNDKARENGKIV